MEKNERNYIKFQIPSKYGNADFASSIVRAFIMGENKDEILLDNTKTAVNEAVKNAILHAYPGKNGKISISANIQNEDYAIITVRDWGCGIEDVEKARQPLFTTGGMKCSGMGFTIIETFVEDVEVKSALGKGTTVKMKICIKKPKFAF